MSCWKTYDNWWHINDELSRLDLWKRVLLVTLPDGAVALLQVLVGDVELLPQLVLPPAFVVVLMVEAGDVHAGGDLDLGSSYVDTLLFDP